MLELANGKVHCITRWNMTTTMWRSYWRHTEPLKLGRKKPHPTMNDTTKSQTALFSPKRRSMFQASRSIFGVKTILAPLKIYSAPQATGDAILYDSNDELSLAINAHKTTSFIYRT